MNKLSRKYTEETFENIGLSNSASAEVDREIGPSPDKQNEDSGKKAQVNKTGLSIGTAAVFIMSEILGSGILTFPGAMKNAGWIGVCLMVVMSGLSAYTAVLLGKCWNILQSRYAEYQGQVRFPYSAMAYVTFGQAGKVFVSLCVHFTCFGVAVVFLLIGTLNMQNLFHRYTDMSLCYWLLIVAICLIPFSMPGTPKDFGFVAFVSVSSSFIGGCVLLASLASDASQREPAPNTVSPTFGSLAAAYGTFMFAFGGHSVYPTIQNDMHTKSDFGGATVIAYSTTSLILVPIGILGYIIYGDFVRDNVLLNMTESPVSVVVHVMVTTHVLFAYLIFLNPISQDVEETFRIPEEFTWKRIVSRSLLVLMTLFVAESIPKFGAILSLIGGTTYTILAFVMPVFVYHKLCSESSSDHATRIPLFLRVFHYEVVVVAIVAGGAAVYVNILTLFNPDTFTYPCYFPRYENGTA